MNLAPIPVALRLLVEEKNSATDEAIIEALPSMNASAQGAALDVLVKRAQPAAMATVVAAFVSYAPDLRKRIGERLTALHHGVRMAVNSPALEVRLAAVEAIREAQDTGCAYLLSDAIKGRCPKTRELAAHVLHDMAAEYLVSAQAPQTPTKTTPATTTSVSAADSLAEALSDVIQSWELHFQPAALEAALWLGDRTEAALRRKLAEAHTKIAHSINDLFTTKTDPRLAGALLRALAQPAIRSSASKALSRGNDLAIVAALCKEVWLLCDAEIAHGCRWIQDARAPQEWGFLLGRLSETQAARAVRFIDATGGSPQRRLDVLRAALDIERGEVRRAIFWRLVEESSEAADAVLRCIAGRTDDDLAEIAARELNRRALRVDRPVEANRDAVPTSPAASTATPSGERDATPAAWRDRPPQASEAHDEIDDLFAQYDFLTEEERRARCVDLGARFPKIVDRLRDSVRNPSGPDRVRALRIAAYTGVERELEKEIFAAAHDPDAAVRSAAVSLLAALPGAASNRLVRVALNDADPRVQANAVETMDKLDASDRADVLSQKLNSPHHRVRANAIKALLRTDLRSAAQSLLTMLRDPQQAHRMSALWVVEHLDLRGVLGRVEELSAIDPDPRVRNRAARVMRHVLTAPAQPSRQLLSPMASPRWTGSEKHP